MRAKQRSIIFVVAALVLGCGLGVQAQKEGPATGVARVARPETPVRDVKEEFFGTEITDHYRWLEDLKSPEVSSWMRAQNDYTRSDIGSIPGREKLRARIAELDNSRGARKQPAVFWRAVILFEAHRGRGQLAVVCARRRGGQRSECCWIRKRARQTGCIFPSIIFRLRRTENSLPWEYPPGGSENSVLHVLDATSGEDAGPSIDRAQFGAVYWLPDNQSFFYNRLRKPAAEDARSARTTSTAKIIFTMWETIRKKTRRYLEKVCRPAVAM